MVVVELGARVRFEERVGEVVVELDFLVDEVPAVVEEELLLLLELRLEDVLGREWRVAEGEVGFDEVVEEEDDVGRGGLLVLVEVDLRRKDGRGRGLGAAVMGNGSDEGGEGKSEARERSDPIPSERGSLAARLRR